MTDFCQMILDFLEGNPDYMLVSGYVAGGVCMKMKALPKSDAHPHGRKMSDPLPLIGMLKQVDTQELRNALYLLETSKTLVCDRYEDSGVTLEMRYTLPASSAKAAA